MTGNFQRPSNVWLCILSALWAIIGLWYGVSFIVAGKIIAGVLMGLFACAALGLWFQSRLAAWTLIVLACAGIVFSLFKIGHAPVLRVISPIVWAIWSLTLLAEYLRGEASS